MKMNLSSHVVSIILALLLLTSSFAPVTAENPEPVPRKSRRMLAINPERMIPSGPSDPEQYRMSHRNGVCPGREFRSSPPPAPTGAAHGGETPPVDHPNRDVPNGPEDPYSGHVKEMSACWKPHV